MKHPAISYVAPMGVFVLFLAVGDHLGLGEWESPLRIAVLAACLWYFSRSVISFRAPFWMGSLQVGAAVFLIWVAPDWLWPGYRGHWLFDNILTGKAQSSVSAGVLASPLVLTCRVLRAVVLVPIIEELFWRAFLLRWLIRVDFPSVPLGAYQPAAFWITAVLFASEHGPYWDVGLAAGIFYNWWMVRAKSLGDCILAHAATNGLLSGYVILTGKWEYWL